MHSIKVGEKEKIGNMTVFHNKTKQNSMSFEFQNLFFLNEDLNIQETLVGLYHNIWNHKQVKTKLGVL